MLYSSQLEVPCSIGHYGKKKNIAFYRRWIFHLTSSSTFRCLSCFEEKYVDHTFFLYIVFIWIIVIYICFPNPIIASSSQFSLSQSVTLRFEYCLDNLELFFIFQSGYMDITKLDLSKLMHGFIKINIWFSLFF